MGGRDMERLMKKVLNWEEEGHPPLDSERVDDEATLKGLLIKGALNIKGRELAYSVPLLPKNALSSLLSQTEKKSNRNKRRLKRPLTRKRR